MATLGRVVEAAAGVAAAERETTVEVGVADAGAAAAERWLAAFFCRWLEAAAEVMAADEEVLPLPLLPSP